MARDYLFYGAGLSPARFRWAVVPARRLLRRLLRPMLYRQVELYRALDGDIEDLRDRLARLEARVERVDEGAQRAAALGWDHVALSRRLAALEDRLDGNGQWAETAAADASGGSAS